MLTRIVLTNFKCLTMADLELKPLTLLTGANSSGKSSVIQAILMSIAYTNQGAYYFRAVLRPYGLQNFMELLTQDASEKRITLSLWDDAYFNAVQLLRGERGEVDVQVVDASISREFEKNLYYLSANRIGAQITANIDEDLTIGVDGSAILGSFDRLKEFPIHEALKHCDASPKLSAQVAYWLSDITDSRIEAQTEQIGSTNQVRSFFKVHDRLEGGLENTPVERSPFNVGAGNSYLLKLIVMCLIAKPNDVLLIENPEIHLHPKAQAKVGKFLAFVAHRGVQVIAETHCEHLINQVRYEVRQNHIDANEVVIHYKPSVRETFDSIFIRRTGHYVDKEDQIIKFPTGFFNATLQQLIEIS